MSTDSVVPLSSYQSSSPRRVEPCVWVNPEMAAPWLDTVLPENRNLSARVVRDYARVMTAGDWLPHHQGIAFDESGHLVDGQHRLAAILLSGATVPLMITWGLPTETFTVIDAGSRRNVGQFIRVPNAHQIAATLRFLVVADPYFTTSGHVQAGVIDSGKTMAEFWEVFTRWQPELETLSPLSKSVYDSCRIAAPPHLAVLCQAARTVHAHRIDNWIAALRDGSDLRANDPRLVLRNLWARNARLLNGSPGRGQAYPLIAKAWNLYVAGKPVQVLRFGTNEPVPVVAGFKAR